MKTKLAMIIFLVWTGTASANVSLVPEETINSSATISNAFFPTYPSNLFTMEKTFFSENDLRIYADCAFWGALLCAPAPAY